MVRAQSTSVSGETWMRLLHEFRDWLKAIREDKSKRDGIKRTGHHPLRLRRASDRYHQTLRPGL